MKIVLIILAILVGIILLMALVGAILPRTHEATRSAAYKRTPAEVYSVIRDFAAMPSWRSGITGVDLLPPRDGHACFREISKNGGMAYIVVEDKAPVKLVTRIADENLPFGGTWTYEISADPNGSRVRITEKGEVKNVIFRFMARFVFGYTGTMETYLRDLGGKFGEIVAPSS